MTQRRSLTMQVGHGVDAETDSAGTQGPSSAEMSLCGEMHTHMDMDTNTVTDMVKDTDTESSLIDHEANDPFHEDLDVPLDKILFLMFVRSRIKSNMKGAKMLSESGIVLGRSHI